MSYAKDPASTATSMLRKSPRRFSFTASWRARAAKSAATRRSTESAGLGVVGPVVGVLPADRDGRGAGGGEGAVAVGGPDEEADLGAELAVAELDPDDGFEVLLRDEVAEEEDRAVAALLEAVRGERPDGHAVGRGELDRGVAGDDLEELTDLARDQVGDLLGPPDVVGP